MSEREQWIDYWVKGSNKRFGVWELRVEGHETMRVSTSKIK